MKRKILLLSTVFVMAFPAVAFAADEGWLERSTARVLTFIARFIFEPILDGMIYALGAMMVNPNFNDTGMHYVRIVMQDMQYLSFSLLTLTLAFQLWQFQTGILSGGAKTPLAAIFFKTGTSAVLILGLPKMLELLIEINATLIEYIKSRGVSLEQGLRTMGFPADGTFIVMVAFIAFIIALVGLTIANAIRMAELCVLYVFAPIMAVSHAGKGEPFQIWITQAITTALSQSLQFFIVGLAINSLANVEWLKWYSYLLPVGAIVLSIKGPQLLKQYLYNSGVGGFATQAGQSVGTTAIYSKMMKGK